MESIVEKMLDEFTGVPVKTVKTFMTKTPSVFTGIETTFFNVQFLKYVVFTHSFKNNYKNKILL